MHEYGWPSLSTIHLLHEFMLNTSFVATRAEEEEKNSHLKKM